VYRAEVAVCSQINIKHIYIYIYI